MYCSQCHCDAWLLRCLDCHEDQDTRHVTALTSLHRSKVGSISAAEAVKSLQQPVLVKADPGGQRDQQHRGELIFSSTLHPNGGGHSWSWYLCDHCVLLKANKDVAGQTRGWGWVRTRGMSARGCGCVPPPLFSRLPPSPTQVSSSTALISGYRESEI